MDRTPEEWKNYALGLLGRRDYSRAKILRKLHQKGCPEGEAVELVDGLVRDGWLREDLYATGRVRSWIRQGYSERAIVSMARREGLDVKPAWVREQFEDLGTDEATQLKRLLVKRSRGGLKAGDEKSRRRILGAAARRGHAPGAASRLLGKGRGDEELPDV